MARPLEDPTPDPRPPRGDDDLGAARGILVGSVCGGLAWGVIVISSWLLLSFDRVGSD